MSYQDTSYLNTYARRFLSNIVEPPDWAQALNIVGEAGEFAEAFRRWTGHARRPGSESEMMNELADVIISASCFAEMKGYDIETLVKHKWNIIMTRGFGQQERPDGH